MRLKRLHCKKLIVEAAFHRYKPFHVMLDDSERVGLLNNRDEPSTID